MGYISAVSTHSGQGAIVIRQIRSINSTQVGIVAEAVATVPAPWRMETHNDYDGYRSIVISLDEADASTFALSGEADRIELCEVLDDTLYARGCFSVMNDAASALIELMRRT